MKYLFIVIGLLVMIFTGSCNPKEAYVRRTVSLSGYERFKNDTSRRLIELAALKSYPANLSCTGAEKYANFYIARQLNGQSLYVFGYCANVSKFISDTTGRYVPLIDTTKILKDRQDSVIIFVPKDLRILTGVKYVFAELAFMVES